MKPVPHLNWINSRTQLLLIKILYVACTTHPTGKHQTYSIPPPFFMMRFMSDVPNDNNIFPCWCMWTKPWDSIINDWLIGIWTQEQACLALLQVHPPRHAPFEPCCRGWKLEYWWGAPSSFSPTAACLDSHSKVAERPLSWKIWNLILPCHCLTLEEMSDMHTVEAGE